MEILIQSMVCEEKYKDLYRQADHRNAAVIYRTIPLESRIFYRQILVQIGGLLQKWGRVLQKKGGMEIDKVPVWL